MPKCQEGKCAEMHFEVAAVISAECVSGEADPLFFFSPPSVFSASSAGMERPAVVEQVDLTPTLALGLGLPISRNSVGRVIPDVLEEASLRDQLRFLHLNGHQLSRLLRDSTPSYQKGGSDAHAARSLRIH